MEDGVKKFLFGLGMMKYYDMFKIKGFDDVSDIPYLTAFDLEYTIMVNSQSDRATILSHACVYQPSSEYAVRAWLCSNSLDYYYVAFLQSDLTNLGKISQLSLPNEDLYDELEIVLPGHRKRLERAVNRLKLEQIDNAAAETPVSYGWWGKPECLPQAKFDFLCVKALLFSSHDPHTTATIDFMVDSGSDVSTVQENTLKGLNLELIGPVYSCGIHGGNHTNLYKGRLKIGDQELDIEVLGSNYDSLGSRVVRHFRHIIEGHQHIWLKGNYTDPLPAIAPIEFHVGTNVSHPSQEIGYKQVPLSITNVGSSEVDIFHGNQDQMTRTPDKRCGDVNSESLQKEPNTTSANNEAHKRDNRKRPHTDESTSLINVLSTQVNLSQTGSLQTQTGSSYHNSTSVQETASRHSIPLPSSHSSASNLPSDEQHTALSNKGKLSLKSNRYDLIKSSTKVRCKLKISKSLNKNSCHKFSHSTENGSESSPSDVLHDGGHASDSLNSSAGIDTLSNNRIASGESLFSNNLPQTLRDTDDVVDYLGDPLMGTKTVQSFQVSRVNTKDAKQILNLEPNSQKNILEKFYKNPSNHSLSLYSHQETENYQKSDLFDVVHISDILVDKMEVGSSSFNGGNAGELRKKLEMNFIPACNEVTLLHVRETDRQEVQGGNGIIAEIYHNDVLIGNKQPHLRDKDYESPKKLGKFDYS